MTPPAPMGAREAGYYWARFKGEERYRPMLFVDGWWTVCGDDEAWTDDRLDIAEPCTRPQPAAGADLATAEAVRGVVFEALMERDVRADGESGMEIDDEADLIVNSLHNAGLLAHTPPASDARAVTPSDATGADLQEAEQRVAELLVINQMIGGERNELDELRDDLVKQRDALEIALAAYLHAAPQPSRVAIRDATLEEAARVADSFTCGACGMDGKAAAAIRALQTKDPDHAR